MINIDNDQIQEVEHCLPLDQTEADKHWQTKAAIIGTTLTYNRHVKQFDDRPCQ